MQNRLRRDIQEGINKTVGYYVEKYVGVFLALLLSIWCYKHFSRCAFVVSKEFTDRLISICATLFGFLLTVLTLIIQSDSGLIVEMKRHGSYTRLIKINKTVIFLSAIVTIISLFCGITLQGDDILTKIWGSINVGFFAWTLFNSFLFVGLFYKLITHSENA